MPFVLWTRVGPRKQVLVMCTLAPPVECQYTIHVRRQCGLLSNYFEHCTRPTYAQRLWTACQWIVAPTTLTGFAVKPLATTRHAFVVECRHVTKQRLCIPDPFLWPPCVADADILFYPCGFFFLSSPILNSRRLHVYHTSTHDVALVRI